MENEDWDSKDDNVINEVDGESSDSNGDGTEDLYRKSQKDTKKTIDQIT